MTLAKVSGLGVHVSGGALQWYTIVYGFGGLTPTGEALHFRPNLPRQWDYLLFVVHWLWLRREGPLVASDGPVPAAGVPSGAAIG